MYQGVTFLLDFQKLGTFLKRTTFTLFSGNFQKFENSYFTQQTGRIFLDIVAPLQTQQNTSIEMFSLQELIHDETICTSVYKKYLLQ